MANRIELNEMGLLGIGGLGVVVLAGALFLAPGSQSLSRGFIQDRVLQMTGSLYRVSIDCPGDVSDKPKRDRKAGAFSGLGRTMFGGRSVALYALNGDDASRAVQAAYPACSTGFPRRDGEPGWRKHLKFGW